MTVRLRLILNGKSADDARVQAAVAALRAEAHQIDLRVTQGEGEAAGFAAQAVADAQLGHVDVIVAGGGDGTINEVFGAAFASGIPDGCSFGVLPLGTANDFARSTGIPVDDPEAALRMCLVTPPQRIDLGLLDGQPFVNLVSGGFGSKVTAETSPTLKSALGPLAYLLTGLSRAKDLAACAGRFTAPGFAWEGSFMAFAIGNGRQAGGGVALCPDALLDDGLLDLMILPVPESGMEAVGALLQGIAGGARSGVTVRAPWIAFEAGEEIAINLDGEPRQLGRFKVECRQRVLPVHLGDNALLT